MITSKNLIAAKFTIFIVFVFILSNAAARMSYDEYQTAREKFIADEQSQAFGSKLKLNKRESLANDVIMKAKREELDRGFSNPTEFLPSIHFFHVFNLFNKSKVYQLLKPMAKGGALHAHDTTLASTDYIVSLTYLPNLWLCNISEADDISFKFSRKQPNAESDCEWKLVSEERKNVGNQTFDTQIRKYFSIYTKDPEKDVKNVNDSWRRATPVFLRLEQMITFEPIFKKYMKTVFRQFYDDGVQYVELRGALPTLYDLDGKTYTKEDYLRRVIEAVEEFKSEQIEFIGAKFIYSPLRHVDDATFATYITTVKELTQKFPGFFVGLDLVGQEDPGRPLIDFIKPLLDLPDNIKFFFHAAETSWNGMSTDENAIDAILLGTKRCGHCFGAIKHVEVLKAIKKKGIAIELNPISHQLSTFVVDQRNHPASHLFAANYPVVVSSDDPSLWEATPLTDDMYIAFMAYTSAYADLRTLKQLAINSILYSALSDAEKQIALSKWELNWHEYIEVIITQGSNM